MKSLKFVMVTTFYPPYHLGGDALHVYYLSNELAKLGYEIHVIHSIDAYHLNRRMTPSGNYPNHERVVLHPLKSKLGIISPLICGFVGLSYPLASRALELIREINPDVIHHHNIVGFGPAILNAKASKVLYTAHDYWLICPRNNLLKSDKTFCDSRKNCFTCCLLWKRPPQVWRYTGILDKKLSNINIIITPSNYMRRTLQSAGVSQPIVIIPNFVPEPGEGGEPIYQFPYFLYVGLLEGHKGILNLVEAFGQGKDEVDASLLIVGDGSLKKRLHQIIAQNSFRNRVKLLGEISERKVLINLYANAQALVIPSICPENAPLVALEALSCGIPIIASSKGGLPEIVAKVDVSLIFEDRGLEDMTRVLTNYNKARYSPQRIRALYQSCYSIDSFISKYERLKSAR